VRSAAQPIALGRTDEEVARRALTIGKPVDELKAEGVAGTPAEVVDRLGEWHERTGVTRFYLQLHDIADLDQIDLIAADVAPHLP
jgi:alkanesulfonate monooxygenase SsuD/methylene tetrahydromethanopterin reductase-like flavin-dependent oxidoreductase (luciferase family)